VRDAQGVHLTDPGRTRAQQIVRAHRLWEAYLAERLRIPLSHVHAPAERLEHVTTPEMAARLAAVTGDPATDPHGTRVPE
jgi:Mn-dependent DtxR family transcriptional regulator